MGAEANPLSGPLSAVACNRIPGATGISNLKRLSGGASQETWSFDVVTADGVVPFILRRAPGGSRDARATAVPLETEAHLIQLAGKVDT